MLHRTINAVQPCSPSCNDFVPSFYCMFIVIVVVVDKIYTYTTFYTHFYGVGALFLLLQIFSFYFLCSRFPFGQQTGRPLTQECANTTVCMNLICMIKNFFHSVGYHLHDPIACNANNVIYAFNSHRHCESAVFDAIDFVTINFFSFALLSRINC
jgi:hypothetical protein